jgi:hypothetical protein
MVVDAGLTIMDVPEPAEAPPQLPVYHCQSVASFKVPVLMLSVVFPPQVGFTEREMVGTVGFMQPDKVVALLVPVDDIICQQGPLVV